MSGRFCVVGNQDDAARISTSQDRRSSTQLTVTSSVKSGCRPCSLTQATSLFVTQPDFSVQVSPGQSSKLVSDEPERCSTPPNESCARTTVRKNGLSRCSPPRRSPCWRSVCRTSPDEPSGNSTLQLKLNADGAGRGRLRRSPFGVRETLSLSASLAKRWLLG